MDIIIVEIFFYFTCTKLIAQQYFNTLQENIVQLIVKR